MRCGLARFEPKLASAVLACLALAAPAAAGAAGHEPPPDAEPDVQPLLRFTPAVELRGFSWKEKLPSSDAQALAESGELPGVGGAARLAFGPARRAYVDLDLRLYLGKVDYSGRLINSGAAYSSRTDYLGLELSPTAGFVFSPAEDLRLTAFGGVGFEWWRRDLDDGGPRGYLEYYSVFLIQAGARADWIVGPPAALHLALGLKMPLVISETADLSRAGLQAEVNLNPGLSPRIVVEAGAKVHGVEATVYWETWTLLQSPPDQQFVAQGGPQLLQPTSTRQLLGVRLGYAFDVQ